MNNNTAVIWGTRRITWEQVDSYCSSAIGQLKGLGLKPGDRVAICAPTSTEYIIVLLSLWRMGVSAAPINPKWPSQTINEYILSIRSQLFLTTTVIKSQVHGISVRTLLLNEIVCFDARREMYKHDFSKPLDENQEVTVIATSGSTGKPKPAVLSWGNHFYNALGSLDVIPLSAHDRWCLSLPLYHVSGLAIVVRCFLAKAAIVLPGQEPIEETILKRDVTHLSLVSTLLYRLIQIPQGIAALKRLKYLLLGGSAMPAAQLEQCRMLNLKAYVSYGLTEMASQVATGPLGNCVRVLQHRDMMIDMHGQILVKGKTLFQGYLQAGRLQRTVDDKGWFATGDIGQMDGQGCLKVLGRKDNMFISGGENIHPEEIEAVLLRLPGIVHAAVVPHEDPEFGMRPVAFIQTEKVISDQQLQEHCAQILPKFKIPIRFYPWPKDMEAGIKISRQSFRRILGTR